MFACQRVQRHCCPHGEMPFASKVGNYDATMPSASAERTICRCPVETPGLAGLGTVASRPFMQRPPNACSAMSYKVGKLNLQQGRSAAHGLPGGPCAAGSPFTPCHACLTQPSVYTFSCMPHTAQLDLDTELLPAWCSTTAWWGLHMWAKCASRCAPTARARHPAYPARTCEPTALGWGLCPTSQLLTTCALRWPVHSGPSYKHACSGSGSVTAADSACSMAFWLRAH